MGAHRLALLAIVGAASACATVANLDVHHEPDPITDSDDGGTSEDAQRADGALAADATTGEDDADRSRPDLVPCGCPMSEGCCVPTAGRGTCVPPADVASCTSTNGIFLRCIGSDLDNGRSCCLAQDARTSFFASTCADASAVLCTKNDACRVAQGETCVPTTCRDVTISVCSDGTAPPSCPK